MPKRWAVGYIDWNDYELHLEIVEASSWDIALQKHSKTIFGPGTPMPDNQDDARQQCFDCDCMMNAIEV